MSGSRNYMMAGALFVAGLFLTAMACASLFVAVPESVPSAARPTSAIVPTETSLPLYQQVALQTSPLAEHGPLLGYTITAQVPVLVGSQDPRVKNFNVEMKTVVNEAVAAFKQNLANLPPGPSSAASTFDLRYNVLSPPGNLISLKFDIQTYYTGAAHPGDASRSVTFDLQSGHDVDLADLFVPDSDFLTPISEYCIAQLGNRDIGFEGFELGATATLGNYRNWNITPQGLMITFDEYQVAPYAAGPQTVVIPYAKLAGLLEPEGPLATYLH